MEEFNDAPREGSNDAPAVIISYPDGFGNVAAKCFGPDMLYSGRVTTEGRTMAATPNHPWCEDGVLDAFEVQE